MEEQRITQQELHDVFHKHFASFPNLYRLMINELFPERPKLGEIIRVWDDDENSYSFRELACFNSDGTVVCSLIGGTLTMPYKNYRRQTPAERGEE